MTPTEPSAARPERESALHRIDAERRLTALQLVREGAVFDLGTDYALDMPRGPREGFHRFQLSQWHIPRCLIETPAPHLSFAMDVVQGSPHLGSHIDAFVHAHADGRIFGGAPVIEHYGEFGWDLHGAETIAPIVTRGILLDVASTIGPDPLPNLFEITPDHLQACLDDHGVELQRGDAVLVRTGKFAADYRGDGTAFFASQPGLGVPAARWLHDRGMAVLGTDTSATEPYPFPDSHGTVHEAMLVERGVHLLEILDLEALAGSGRREFLFVCLPLKLRGATGSWVRPIAMV